MERLQTKQMQSVFQYHELQKKVSANFEKIKVDTLEQIVKSNIIKEILSMSSLKKSPKTQQTSINNEVTPLKNKHWDSSALLQPRDFKLEAPFANIKSLKIKKLIPNSASKPSEFNEPTLSNVYS